MTSKHLLLGLGFLLSVAVSFQAGRMSPVAPERIGSAIAQPVSVPTSEASVVLPLPATEAPAIEGLLAGDAVREPLIGIASYGSQTYVAAIESCGGIPVVLPDATANEDRIDDYLDLLDGLLMPGGPDIPPSEYGEEPHPTVKLLDDERYRFEKAMLEAWINETEKPLLGICLGSQWINVVHGGTLIQDIPTERGINHRDTNHPVTLEPDSRLAGIFGATEFEVNSFHHQATDTLGDGLRAVAFCPSGVIEATESINPERFLIGVQWHPEKMMPDDRLQAKVIEAFIEAASEQSLPN